MLVFIIDAFNLAHRVPALRKSPNPCRDIVNFIYTHRLTGSMRNRVIVVFDGKSSYDVRPAQPNCSVLFSFSESADDVIVKQLRRFANKSEVVVVSDDRQIRDQARHMGARLCRISDFIRPKTRRHNRGQSESNKDISHSLQREITEELRRIWLDGK